MIRREIRTRLERLFDSQRASDPEWLEALDEFDEVPLFERLSEVEFLRELPASLRGHLIFEVALAQLDKLAVTLDSLEHPEKYFASLTFLDWDDLGEERLAPTPHVLVSPNWAAEMPSPEFRSPATPEGHLVVRWKRVANRADLCVVEGPEPQTGGEPHRIYLGYNPKIHRFRTVGDFELTD